VCMKFDHCWCTDTQVDDEPTDNAIHRQRSISRTSDVVLENKNQSLGIGLGLRTLKPFASMVN